MWKRTGEFLRVVREHATLSLALEETWRILDELASSPNEKEFESLLRRWQFIPAMYVAEWTAVMVACRKDVPREFWTAMARCANRMHLPREADRYTRIASTGEYIAG